MKHRNQLSCKRTYPWPGIVTCAVMLLAVMVGPVLAQTMTWGSIVNVSNTPGRSSYFPQIAATEDAVHAIWYDTDTSSPPGSAYYKRSLDGGVTWQDLHVLSNALLLEAEIVASGNVVTAFWRDTDGTQQVIRYARSTDAGLTWSSSQSLSSVGNVGYIRAAVGEGKVVAIWTEMNGSTSVIKMRLSTDESQTFENATDVITVNNNSAQGDVAIAGSALVVGFNDSDQVYSIRSTDWGQSWSSLQQVSSVATSETSSHLRMAAFGSSLVMKWGQFIGPYNGEAYVAASADGGTTWSSPRVLSEGFSGENRTGDVCIWGNRAVAVWTQNTGSYKRLYFRRSLDGGQTWESAILIHQGDEFIYPRCASSESSVYVVGYWLHDGGDIWLVRGLDPSTPQFTEVGVSAGMNDSGGSARGMAWGDFDNDGDLDLYLSNWASANRLYQNNGSGAFTEIGSSAGVNDSGNGTGVAWGDFDNDGDLDLYLANDSGQASRLYQNNGNGTFTDVGASVGANATGWGVVWGDYNSDGHLDLYVSAAQSQLYRNNGSGTFTEVGASVGVNSGGGPGPTWGDYDNDGDLDLYVARNSTNWLYRNNGNGTFTEVGTSAGVNDSGIGHGAAWGDYDNDGDLDLHLSNVGGPTRVYQNNGNGTFTDVRASVGVSSESEVGVAWGDYDNDGGIDLYVTNQGGASGGPHWLYRNNGDGTFTEVAASSGANGSGHGAGVAWGDYDNDGDLDLYVGHVGSANLLYRNNGNTNRWLTVKLVGTTSNKAGLGAQVTAVTGSIRQRRDVGSGSGYFAQSSLPVEFGFGGTAVVDELIVEWPSGIVQTLTDVATNPAQPPLLIVETPTLSVPNMTAMYNQIITVPVQLSDVQSRNIVSAEVFLSYDSSLLTFDQVITTGTLSDGWTIETNDVPDTGDTRMLKIAAATNNRDITSDGTLLEVQFTVANTRVPDSSPLTLGHVLLNDGDPENVTTDGSVTLIGTNGTIATGVDQIIPRESIVVTVTDADENWDDAATDAVTVVVTNLNNSDTVTLTMDENAVDSGIFVETIATEFGTVAVADGLIQAQDDDVIEFRYTDDLNGDGGPEDQVVKVNAYGKTDGMIQVSVVTQPGDLIRIKVVDVDLNTDGTVQTVTVTADNSSGDSEQVTLTEVDGNDEVFFGELPTTPNAGSSGDGELTTAKGDVVTVTYDDVVTALGDQVDRTDDDTVVDPFGDADGNGQVQAYDASLVLQHVLNAFLTGLDALSADVGDPFAQITHFDASLILQKVVGKITLFPVQETGSENHPQPNPSSPKRIPDERLLTLRVHDGYLSVWVGDRSEIVSGDLLVEGISGQVEMSEELVGFLSASRATEEGLRIVFAGAEAVSGPGELLRVYGVGPADAQLTRADFNDGSIVARIGETMQVSSAPSRFALHPNHPNPFNPETTIRYDVPETGMVRLRIYDVAGQVVRTLTDAFQPAGSYSVVWDGRNEQGDQVANSVYLYELRAGDYRAIRKMLLMK